MATYNFFDLSPFDFELLAKEIAEKKYKRNFEAFTTGRDGGIDLRSDDKKTLFIGQCKHYAKSGFSQLKSTLKNEITKVKGMNPTKYIVFTSLGLTPENKNELVSELSELKLAKEDILDSVALNAFIETNPEIEKHHIKLWLNSSAVLESIVFKEINIRTKFFKDEMLKNAKFWVNNSYVTLANKYLEKKHFCIISGIPGIGKTTLAEMICLNYCKEKYVLVKINSFEEFLKAYSPEEKQVFFYDDFLGETHFKDDKNFDDLKIILSHLNNDCKFIFTTREYVYKQAKKNEKFSALNLDKNILILNGYTNFEKALILYNHLFYGNVNKEICKYIVEKKKYWEIINHKNYSPRIIDFMCDGNHIDDNKDTSLFCEMFVHNLEYPNHIWDHAFKYSVELKEKYILYSLFFLGNGTDVNILREISYIWIKRHEPNLLESQYFDEFKNYLAELENTFIKIDSDGDKYFISFHNPSLIDYFETQITPSSPKVKEFNSLPHVYWNQKEIIINYLPIKERKQILKFLCSNLSLPQIKRYYNNGNTDLEKKVYYLDFILKDRRYKVLEDYYNKKILKEIFKQNEIQIPLLNYILTYTKKRLNIIQKYKLKKLFLENKNIYFIKEMLQINEKNKFIDKDTAKEYLYQIKEQKEYKKSNDELTISELNDYQDYYNYLIKHGYSFFQEDLDLINNKIDELYESIEDDIADAEYEERKFQELEDRSNEEITMMFDSLLKGD